MKVLVITGGNSSERKISLISAKAVAGALRANGHAVTMFDFKKGFPALKKALVGQDAVFPVMHGKEGEDGTLYAFLRRARIPYVGSDSKGAKVAFDKILFKKFCEKHGIPTARWKIIRKKEDIVRFGFPCVLKAAEGGSSHEVALLRSQKDLDRASVKQLLKMKRLFVEGLLEGVEITAGVLNGKALPLIEIVPPGEGWFDYKNKYSGGTREIPFAPSVKKSVQSAVQRYAVLSHKELQLGSYSRMDFIVQDGTAYALETNTPGGVGMTSESLFPKAANAIGLSFEQLVEKLLRGHSR